MLDALATIGPWYKAPSYYNCRTNLLKDLVQEVQMSVDKLCKDWATYGCTIIANSWTDTRSQTLINFLVYCPTGTAFVKSADASKTVKSEENLFLLFKEVINWVKAENVVQVVTNNATNYVAAGRLLEAEFPWIYWSPCATHCLNLMLKEIGEMDYVANVVQRASRITKFIYNHIFVLSMLRKRPGWTEIVRPGATRFATNFIALDSILKHMHDLQNLVTDWSFIDSSALRLADSEFRPAMGYMYHAMLKAKESHKKFFNYKKAEYGPIMDIIDRRWNRQNGRKTESLDPIGHEHVDVVEDSIVHDDKDPPLLDGNDNDDMFKADETTFPIMESPSRKRDRIDDDEFFIEQWGIMEENATNTQVGDVDETQHPKDEDDGEIPPGFGW
ncbi:PREDICTED: uncharacterized protein LOC104602233 [Nelumbo nucifera]|uniref:Uncharacterized protein LOC104602233 n=1 Tax=Nelumbo nucifera TaxID=4432 RepID=A0A1U8ABH6_NELNU|nr:PREDICTED: uncharacterized protein LOC104602233 [Nelumbo nucifera]